TLFFLPPLACAGAVVGLLPVVAALPAAVAAGAAVPLVLAAGFGVEVALLPPHAARIAAPALAATPPRNPRRLRRKERCSDMLPGSFPTTTSPIPNNAKYASPIRSSPLHLRRYDAPS